MLATFRVVYWLAAVLSLTAGGLVIASPFVTDRAPVTAQGLAVHAVVGAAFLAIGLVTVGVLRRTAAIAGLVRSGRTADTGDLQRHMAFLLAWLVLGGIGFCTVLALLTCAILARIDEGFAVFG